MMCLPLHFSEYSLKPRAVCVFSLSSDTAGEFTNILLVIFSFLNKTFKKFYIQC